jgi:asparagine synthase (glutamine-hydrolysing)
VSGIYGFIGENDERLLERMSSVLIHRGPDDVGEVQFPGVSLGHRRLSVIDVSSGHQPISNEDESLWLVFNGEIYNYRELRTDLIGLGHKFRTDSDAEVVLHSYEEYGPACFNRFNGMWALALADLKKQKVILVRDHFGIKPLHYAVTKNRLLFASEIKAILQDTSIKARPNDQMIYEYLTQGLHDHCQNTFFQDIYRVMPATYVEVDISTTQISNVSTYWTPNLSEDGNAAPVEFHRLFKKAVERRLISEVPVGASLSGGLDSTSIVCLMRDVLEDKAPAATSLGGKLKTFSAVFDNDPIDEQEYITVAIRESGADPTYVRPDAKTFADELMDFIWHQEEPVVSTGPYAQWCVMKEAKESVKVILDGQGGDELLAGYVPYHFVYLRQLLKERKIGLLLKETWAAKDVMLPLLTRRLKQRKQHFPIKEALRQEFASKSKEPSYGRSSDNLKERLLKDLTTYSLPCLLRYEDRNSMAFSIASRTPYLDQELVEWILKLPSEAIIHDGWSRAILREGLLGVIPEKIRKRRWKVGFTTPEMRWLKRLRATFTSLYRSPTFQSRPYWKGHVVAKAFRDACEGKVENSMFFWRAANVELWLRTFIDIKNTDSPGKSIETVGDQMATRLLGDSDAANLIETYSPNHGKHLFSTIENQVYARLPIRTEIVKRGDNVVKFVTDTLSGKTRPGDIVAVAEKPISISQGRSFPIDDMRPSWLAKVLSKAVTKTPHGIGLGMPQTMQLALNEVGAPRIIFAAAVAAVARLFGVRGVFYKIAGPEVEAIDGPTPGTLPPYNKQASLGPKNPDSVATKIAEVLNSRLVNNTEDRAGVGVAIVDTNDLSVAVLGHSEGVNPKIVAELMIDNPMGQGHEQTPIVILRKVGELE